MAVRLTRSSTQYLKLESNLPDGNDAYTICGWLRTSDTPGFSIFGIGSGSYDDYSNADNLLQGSPLWCFAYVSGSGSNTSPDYESAETYLGVWQHVALVRASDNDLSLYRNGVKITSSNTTNVAGRSATEWLLLGHGYGGTLDGRLKDVKVWTRGLTEAEMVNEMRTSRPQSTNSLYAWWPLMPGSRTVDYSGNGHTLTEVNSPTDEADPPIPFGTPVVSVPAITASSGTTVTPTTATLTLSTFAPVLKHTTTPSTASLTTSTFAPAIGNTLTPSTASLATSTFAPVLRHTTTPTTASLALSTFVPVLRHTTTPTTASLVFTTYAPTLGDATNVVPSTASLSLSTFAPVLYLVVTPTTAALVTSTFAPTVSSSSGDVTVTPTTVALVLATFAPNVSNGDSGDIEVTPSTATLTLTTFVPRLTDTVTPEVGELAFTTYAPSINDTGVTLVTPLTAELVFTTYAPTIGNTTPRTYVSYGFWVADGLIPPGAEWRILLTGPAADVPAARVVARFLES